MKLNLCRRVAHAWNYHDPVVGRTSVPHIDQDELSWGPSTDKPGGIGKWLFHHGKLLTFMIFATVHSARFVTQPEGVWLDRLELDTQLMNPADEDTLASILGKQSQPVISKFSVKDGERSLTLVDEFAFKSLVSFSNFRNKYASDRPVSAFDHAPRGVRLREFIHVNHFRRLHSQISSMQQSAFNLTISSPEFELKS